MYVRATGIAGEVTRIAKRRGVCAACIPIGERWWEPRRGRDGRTDWTGTGIIKTERKRQQVSQARHPTAEEKKGKEGRRGKASASCPFLFLLLLLLPSSHQQPSHQHRTPLALFLIPSGTTILAPPRSKVEEKGRKVVIAAFLVAFFS
jgi:hypothetical protein